MPQAVQQLAAVALGAQPKLVVATGQIQTRGLDELRMLRRLVVTLMVAGSAFAILSAAFTLRWFLLRRGPRRS